MRGRGGHRGSLPRSCALGNAHVQEKGRPCLRPSQTPPFGVPSARPPPGTCYVMPAAPTPAPSVLNGRCPLPQPRPLFPTPPSTPFCLS